MSRFFKAVLIAIALIAIAVVSVTLPLWAGV